MTLATLRDVLQPAFAGRYAVAGLVVLGWEDARAYVAAAEAEGVPVILQAGPGCRAHTPLPILGAMFRHLAERASVPVVAHLDHGYEADECREAIECGFTSVMYDGSRKPLDQNIAETARIVEMAHAAGVSCEGELGFVGYAGGETSQGTDPDEATAFARQTGIDALAVSIGNTHLQQSQGTDVDEARLRAIEAVTDLPLVLHGGSGLSHETRQALATTSNICKFNIGTELRMVFGSALRASLSAHPDSFDRTEILSQVHEPLVTTARKVLRALR